MLQPRLLRPSIRPLTYHLLFLSIIRHHAANASPSLRHPLLTLRLLATAGCTFPSPLRTRNWGSCGTRLPNTPSCQRSRSNSSMLVL